VLLPTPSRRVAWLGVGSRNWSAASHPDWLPAYGYLYAPDPAVRVYPIDSPRPEGRR
jgi:hypothetical protein